MGATIVLVVHFNHRQVTLAKITPSLVATWMHEPIVIRIGFLRQGLDGKNVVSLLQIQLEFVAKLGLLFGRFLATLCWLLLHEARSGAITSIFSRENITN